MTVAKGRGLEPARRGIEPGGRSSESTEMGSKLAGRAC